MGYGYLDALEHGVRPDLVGVSKTLVIQLRHPSPLKGPQVFSTDLCSMFWWPVPVSQALYVRTLLYPKHSDYQWPVASVPCQSIT
jgi:hypothetical protein